MREILQTAAHFCKNFKLPISLPVESFTCAIGSQVLEDRTPNPDFRAPGQLALLKSEIHLEPFTQNIKYLKINNEY